MKRFLPDRVWEHDMRYYFAVLLLVGIASAIVLTGCQRANPVAVNESQQSGVVGEDPAETIEGTFWIDRWGQGRFPPYVEFVDESVFPKLVDHAGVPVRISKPIALGEQQPGDLLLSSFHRLERLPQSVSLRLRWKTTDNKTSENKSVRLINVWEFFIIKVRGKTI